MPVVGPAAQGLRVVAPLCIVAGCLCTLAMLVEGEAHTVLEEQRMPYLAMDEHGATSGSLAARLNTALQPSPRRRLDDTADKATRQLAMGASSRSRLARNFSGG